MKCNYEKLTKFTKGDIQFGSPDASVCVRDVAIWKKSSYEHIYRSYVDVSKGTTRLMGNGRTQGRILVGCDRTYNNRLIYIEDCVIARGYVPTCLQSRLNVLCQNTGVSPQHI